MNNKTIAYEAGLFLFQLNNSADESGFRTDESWVIKLADEIEMTRIRKNYAPSVISLIAPSMLVEVFKIVKVKLQQSEDKEVSLLDKQSIERQALNYIVAYNVNREIR